MLALKEIYKQGEWHVQFGLAGKQYMFKVAKIIRFTLLYDVDIREY